MKPIPLTAPDGTVFAYACGECRRVAGGSSYMANRYSDDEVRSMADLSLTGAANCCGCRKCGAYIGEPYNVSRNGYCVACWEGGERQAQEARHEKWKRIEHAFEVARGESLSRSKDPAAALDLEQLMSDTSELCYCAGWLIGCEHALWDFCQEGPGRWGMDEVDAEDVARMRELSERCGGWWYWREGDDETIGSGRFFVTLDEWAQIHAKGIRAEDGA